MHILRRMKNNNNHLRESTVKEFSAQKIICGTKLS